MNRSRSKITTRELAKVDQAIINMVNPIKRPITDTLDDDFGVYESSMSDMMTIVKRRSTPIVMRSTHVGGKMNMLIVINSINTHGHTNRFT